ncbi:MAG TPA: hypothetical protein EYH45_02660 [Candidatus Caldiarchaeum subterraneum]|uniref:Permease n=1 Tax=Caldiarchaeum subterraneum TaxID=311458 RepID=A0A833E9G9_CALS0|nr:hypothetical protein [Candidatus Caldarchaeum subterraneum]
MVNPMVVGFAVATVLLYIVGYVKDPGNVSKAVRETLDLLFNPSQGFAYIVVAAFFLAGMLSILLPSEVIAAYLGREAGMKGILIGTAAGAVTPGGPFLFFPILLGLYKAGASVGALIAYISAWALLAVHRILTWEFPLMGLEFAASRVLVSLAIPVILGVAGQYIHDLLFSGP